MAEGGGDYGEDIGDDGGAEISEGDQNDVPDEISSEQPDNQFDEYIDEDPGELSNDDPFDEYPDEDPGKLSNDDPFDEYPEEDPNEQPNDDPFDEYPDKDPNEQLNDDPFDEYPEEDPNEQLNDDPFDEYPDEVPNEQSNDDPFDEFPDDIVDEVHEELNGEEKNSEESVEEINSSLELENIGTDQSTLILQQESQEPFSRDKEGNIILDADTMEFFGEHVSSQEEMKVEILEEEMEELFKSYEENGLEQEKGSVASHDLEQESIQERQELEPEIQIQQQEETINQKMEEIQEQELNQELSHKSTEELSQTPKEYTTNKMESPIGQDEDENLQESSKKGIQEIKRDPAQKKKLSQEHDQEIEQEPVRETHQNVDVIQEKIREQFEEQKKPTLKESDIKEQYKQETGRRPIYAGNETRGFIEWKEYLKQQNERQEEKNELLHEKEEEIKEQSKEIRESKEEWAQYLAKSIKKSEIPEDLKEKLGSFLKDYDTLREMLEKLKSKEISEEEFEKEVKKFEPILIEKRSIARPLFMNFDWFRRYYNEMIRKSGKRVANLYISKKTREFLSYISGRIEQLENRGNLYESAEKFEEFLEKSFQIREKWALLLNNLIHEVTNKEISKEAKKELKSVITSYCEIRAILFNNKILKEVKEKLIQERIEKCNPRFFKLFEILKRFLGSYDNFSRNWMEQSLIFEGKKTVRRLSQKLEKIKKENAMHYILNEKRYSVQNFKENLKQNLYKTTELNMNEKSKIIKFIQSENFDEENKVKLTNILSKLSIEDLISFLGDDFKQYSQTYVKNRTQEKDPSTIRNSLFITNANLKQEVLNHINLLLAKLTNCTEAEINFIKGKSFEILKNLISEAKIGEINITKKARSEVIAISIIYTVLKSHENMPEVNISKISGIPMYTISKYYSRYFKNFYINENFKLSSYYGFSRIRNIICKYIFNKKNLNENIILSLELDILNSTNLLNQLNKKEIELLNILISNQRDDIIKYFSDLIEVINIFFDISKFYKIIGAPLIIKPIAESLFKNEINLFQSFKIFYQSIIEIYDYLKTNFPKDFIKRARMDTKEDQFYTNLIGSNIKIYLIKHIYNGLYYKKKIGECPECAKEGFAINTDISRLKALEFHHPNNKDHKYSAKTLYELFNKDRANPYFLEDLIDLIESENVVIVCANHHDLISRKYFNYFKHLISWINLPVSFPQDFFSLSPELIHTLVRIAINNYSKTRNKSSKKKGEIKLSVISYLKKRYIIEYINGVNCPACGEFNTKEHLVSFHFNHFNKLLKTILASDLFKSESITCSEIVQILEGQKGSYICSNCHSVFHKTKFYDLLKYLYTDKNMIKTIIEDHKNVRKNSLPIYYDGLINDPLKLSKRISEKLESHLIAIYEMSKTENTVTNSSIAQYLDLTSRKLVDSFFGRSDYMKDFVKIDKNKKIHTYSLTKKGIEAVSLIYYFRKYYNSL